MCSRTLEWVETPSGSRWKCMKCEVVFSLLARDWDIQTHPCKGDKDMAMTVEEKNKFCTCSNSSPLRCPYCKYWTANAPPITATEVIMKAKEREAALVDKIRNTADSLEPRKLESLKPRKVIRKLRWKRKEYEVAACNKCEKVRPLPGGDWLERMQLCYKCIYRYISDLDKLASDLQAATLGGEYLPEELEKEVEPVYIDKKAFARLTRDMILYSMNGDTTVKWSKPEDPESFLEGVSLDDRANDADFKLVTSFPPEPNEGEMIRFLSGSKYVYCGATWNRWSPQNDLTDPGDSIDTVYDQTRDKQMEAGPPSKLEEGS